MFMCLLSGSFVGMCCMLVCVVCWCVLYVWACLCGRLFVCVCLNLSVLLFDGLLA